MQNRLGDRSQVQAERVLLKSANDGLKLALSAAMTGDFRVAYSPLLSQLEYLSHVAEGEMEENELLKAALDRAEEALEYYASKLDPRHGETESDLGLRADVALTDIRKLRRK